MHEIIIGYLLSVKMKIKSFFSIVLFSVTAGFYSSCGDDSNEIINKDPEPEIIQQNPYLSRIEVPKLEKGNVFIQHSTKMGSDSVMTYCLEYNPKKYHSRWVAFRFDNLTRVNDKENVSRKDYFMDDPDLSSSQGIGYNGFGKKYVDAFGITRECEGSAQFDRGHICASDDRKYSQDANDQTFYMSNMSPQLSNFNGIFWLAFEQKVQDLGRSASFADTLYVVKGGTITDDKTIGYISRTNGAHVTIPKYYYMALLAVKGSSYKSIGFYMEHKEYGYKKASEVTKDIMAGYAVSIDELEKVTGIDFFHNLPDAIENSVEAVFTASDWGL